MSLPQVKVWEKTISTVSGQPYAIYIDYIAASESDLTSLRPQDVLRVEVLKFPMDPRFSGQENVINFIMRKSERGGYTKLTAYGRVVTSSEVNGGVYQKLRLGRWTVDASVSGEGYRASDIGSSSTELFGGITFGGIHYDELKRETRDMLLSKTTNTQKATLRGAYSHDKTYISHTFSYTREAQPRNTSEGTVTYSHNLPSATSLSDETSQSINFSVGGHYNFGFGKENFIQADWGFDHSRNRSHSLRQYSASSDIINDSREAVLQPARHSGVFQGTRA